MDWQGHAVIAAKRGIIGEEIEKTPRLR